MLFLRCIEHVHHFIPAAHVPFHQRIGKLLGGIILFGHMVVGEYQPFIQHVEVVPHLPLAIFMPRVDHAAFRVPHMLDLDFAVVSETVFIFCKISVQFTIDQPESILLICAPEVSFLHPDGVEVAASNHQILRFFDDKFRIDLDYVLFWRTI